MTHLDFEFNRDKLQNTAQNIIDTSIKLGATSAQVEVNENISTAVSVLNGEIENLEHNYSSNLNLTVYIQNNVASIAISQIEHANLDKIILQALDIAKYTEPDANNGIAESNFICKSFEENLQLYNPSIFSNQELITKAQNIEDIGFKLDHRIINSNGAGITSNQHNFVIASSNGLNLGYKTTTFTTQLSLIAGSKNDMQTSYWYSSKRDFANLISDNDLAKITVERTVRRLNKGQIKSGNYPVIFEYPIAKSLISKFLSAISGTNLYRKISFLNDSLYQQIFPNWVNIMEDPFIAKGLASCYFDNEGVNVKKQAIVDHGIVNNYLLTCYSARKMQMQPTGHAGGWHNILIQPNFNGGIIELAQKMHRGMIIIETLGHGLNMVTGDYSTAAAGLWIDHGEIQFFVDNITISCNLKDIYKNIQYIGSDCNSQDSINCGSILTDNVTISTNT